jgi:hypothetical protein
VLCALGGLPATALASTAAPVTPPPDLVALEQKLGELKLTSLRFTIQTKLSGRHVSREVRQFFELFGLGAQINGEETLSPEAGEVTLTLFGERLTVRVIGSGGWVSFPALAAHDGGRRWIALGPGGLGELFTLEEPAAAPSHPEPLKSTFGQPDYAEAPFTKLEQLLAGARELRELGPGTADGQPVTRFRARLRPAQLEQQEAPPSKQLLRERRRLHLPPPPTPTLTLGVAFAASGMPVRIVLAQTLSGTTTTATVDIPSVNFPLTIEAPAASETITIAELRTIAAEEKARRRARAKAKHRHRKPTAAKSKQ